MGANLVSLKCFVMKDIKDEKTKTEIELDSFLVAVCKNKELKPFSNTFHFEGENLAQLKLGELFGIIRIQDQSEESAYLPNLLAQVIKREFFLKPNRGTEESFGAALNKVNLALEDLAQHEVTSWIGTLDAVIGVMNKDELHFTKLGEGHIFLSKNKRIVNISEGLNEDINVHPVKTFSDISSGKLSIEDKIIFSTEELFKSLSWEEITRHTNTFTSNEFDNILKSTLDLEGEDVSAITVNIKEKSVMPIPKEKVTSGLNFFGESDSLNVKTSLGSRCKSLKNLDKKTTEKDSEGEKKATDALISTLIPKKTRGGEIDLKQKKGEEQKETPEKKNSTDEVNGEKTLNKEESGEKKQKGFEDKVNKEKKKRKENLGSSPISPFEEEPELFIKEDDEEKFEMDKIDEDTEKSFNSVLGKVKRTLEDLRKNNTISANSIPLISKLKLGKQPENIKDISFNNDEEYQKKLLEEVKKEKEEKEKMRKEKEEMRLKNEGIREKEERRFEERQARKKRVKRNIAAFSQKISDKTKSIDFEVIITKIKDFFVAIAKNIKSLYSTIQTKTKTLSPIRRNNNGMTPKTTEENFPTQEKVSFKNRFTKTSSSLQKSMSLVVKSIKQRDKKIDIERIIGFCKRYKLALITIASLLFIFIAVLSFILLRKKDNGETLISEIRETIQQELPVGEQVDITAIADIKSEIQSITGDKDELFIITTSGKFFKLNITNNNLEEIPLKNSVRDIKRIVSMPTLRLIFLISEKDVFSYSPVVNRLTDVNVKFPNNLSIGGAGVYLENLYLLDKTSKNIYQFSRKPGGFNNYKTRTASQQFFSSAIDLAVDDSLLVSSENGEIQQYFKGKLKTSFSAKSEGYDEVKIADIETRLEPNTIFALDSKNGFLLKIPRDNPGEKERHFNQKFIDAQHFWINEKQDRAFISTKNGEILRLAL